MRVCSLGKFPKILFVALLTVFTMMTLLTIPAPSVPTVIQLPEEEEVPKVDASSLENGKWRNLSEEKVKELSRLGRILFLDEPVPVFGDYKQYKILVWKYGNTIDDRHVMRYTNQSHDPLEFCSVKNCKVTYNGAELSDADLVIVHLHRTKGVDDLPSRKNRKVEQRWAFLTDESPYHTFLNSKVKLKDFNGIFNWSMTYRMDSDIPVPYGRTVFRNEVDDNYNFKLYSWLLTKKHDVLIVIMGSNCGSQNHRWEYVKELQKHIPVDVYGKCGTLKCAGHFRKDCPQIADYMFYLSFENSNCEEYITEKLWWNAYTKDSIPIVMGATRRSYYSLLPPDSYINTDNFASPHDLANYINYLINTPGEMSKYFVWKKRFRVLNEHGYFQSVSYHYCRACEALNYNDRRARVYKDLEGFWSVGKDCYPAWDKIY